MLHLEKDSFQAAIQSKVIDPKDLEAFCLQLKNSGKTLVTINGSFDLLHPGHLDMLYKASNMADILIVLLNTDSSIQAYKSKKRPIQPLEDRIQFMAALEMVDYVSYFEETDPRATLEKIKPHIHANGSEYGEDCIEASVVKKNGGKIQIIELIEGYSTTKLIQRIKEKCE